MGWKKVRANAADDLDAELKRQREEYTNQA